MSKPVLVVIFRRDVSSLTLEERTAIEAQFPGRPVEYRRTDPENYKQHDEQCKELHPALVLLPLERPVPALAMERGVVHVAMTPGGLMWLKSITPVFEPIPAPAPND